MSDPEVSSHSEVEEEELEEEEEDDFTNLPLYADDDDDSGSEFELPSESENEAAKAKKAKSRLDSRQQSQNIASPLAFRPAPKKSALKKTSQVVPQSRRSNSLQILEDPEVTARRMGAPTNKKRKATRPAPQLTKREKRLKTDTDRNYLFLLNNQIRHAVEPKLNRALYKLKRSHVGASMWRKSEKAKLYVALERVGKYDYKAIAEFIGTKSQPEVREYIEVFEEAMRRRAKSGRISSWKIEEVDVPAAAEISQECCELLDETAHAMTLWQDSKARRREIRKWGSDAWLLSAENVSWIEKDAHHKAGETVIKEVLPAAELLNLRNWLKLSKGVFMNPADRPEQNWQEIIEPGDEHGIFATAFSDFHTLTVSLTKRIMAATMFAAELRLRSDQSWYARTKGRLPKVTHVDVATAVENMGMKLDSHEFWRTAARRNHLNMVDDEVDGRNGKVAPMSHDLVEKVLSKRKKIRSKRRMRLLANADRAEISAGTSAYDSDEEGSHISVSSDDDDDTHATQEIKRGALKMAPTTELERDLNHYHPVITEPVDSPHELVHSSAEQTPEERYVAYVESVDHIENVREEVALWDLLKQQHPFEQPDMDIEAAEEAELSKVRLKQKDDLQTDKWRERSEYWAPWEHLDGLPTEVDFSRRSKRHKDVDAAGSAVRRVEGEKTSQKAAAKPAAKKKVARKASMRASKQAKEKENKVIDIMSDEEVSDDFSSDDVAGKPAVKTVDVRKATRSPKQPKEKESLTIETSSDEEDSDASSSDHATSIQQEYDTTMSAAASQAGVEEDEDEDAQEEDKRYASPVFTNTQLDALMGTQEPLGSLPEMEMEMDFVSDEEEA